MEWYTISDIGRLDTPALVVYPERVKENIRQAIAMVGDVARLRPHVKTHKSAETTKLMLSAGISRFKCATIAEAEMLAMAGAVDVLLAYQPIGPKAARFAALVRRYPGVRWSCLVDNAAAARGLADAGLEVDVWLDLNVGMDRTGITPGPEAVALFKEVLGLPGLRPVGLHAYDGHIRAADLAERRKLCDEAYAKVVALRDAIGAELAIIAGGSPTFPVHAQRVGIECSPGTFVYWDKGYGDGFPDQPFIPAALVVTRVISLRGDSRLCLDLGHKSIAPENELGRRVHFLNAPQLRAVGQSEEHLVVEAGVGHGYRIGDIFYGIPYHICPTVALYERAFTIDRGKLSGEIRNIARDRMLSV
ncbi:MAG: D-TA family PLP-dependent enzyme [Bacteroidetes bacterium]|nr:D-TA family PLP-dependent enzyme [Bacteroidota bacterium]